MSPGASSKPHVSTSRKSTNPPGPVLIGLLRAVNVGGTGKLPMRDLSALCTDLGFTDVRTYIQSGNVVFRSRLSPERAGGALERALARLMGKRVEVIIRQASELREVLQGSPFPDAPPAKVAVMFLSAPVPGGVYDGLVGPAGEMVVVSRRELYVYYPEGMGRSKLKIPKLPGVTTVRNLNTVAMLVEMCRG